MASRNRNHLGGRVTPRGTHLSSQPWGGSIRPGVPIGDLIGAVAEVDGPETSAWLAGLAELASDELRRARARRALGRRTQHVPDWLASLDEVEAYRCVERVHGPGDGDDVIVGMRLAGGHELTVVVSIDHNMGTLVKDAFVLAEPIGTVVELMKKHGDAPEDAQWVDIDPADARVLMSEAVDRAAMTIPAFETDTWPACRPIVEWALRLLPWEVFDDDGDDWDDDFIAYDPETERLDALRRAAGGAEALAELDDRPLPDEAFRWDGIAGDIRGTVAEALTMSERCCDELLDVEYRTACRRLLAGAAASGPNAFRRKARTDITAATICWIIGRSNELFSASTGGMTAKELLAHFGLTQSGPSQRAATLLKAAGIETEYGYRPVGGYALGVPGLLVSIRRRRLIAMRDRPPS